MKSLNSIKVRLSTVISGLVECLVIKFLSIRSNKAELELQQAIKEARKNLEQFTEKANLSICRNRTFRLDAIEMAKDVHFSYLASLSMPSEKTQGILTPRERLEHWVVPRNETVH